eukprot:471656_1
MATMDIDHIGTSFIQVIQQQLYDRDLREKVPFEKVSISYNLLLDENVDLSKRVSDLSQALLQLKQDNWNKPSLFTNQCNDSGETTPGDTNKKAKHKNRSPNVSPASHANYEVSAIKDENESLRKELMDVYRLKKENEEALSRLKKQSIENEELILNQTRSINEISIKHQQLTGTHSDLEDEHQILKSNVVLLNRESVELRKAHDNAMKELDQYKDENRRLTEQLLKLKETQIESMDKLNDEYEKLRKLTDARIASNHHELKLDEPYPHSPQRRHTTLPTKPKSQSPPQVRHRWSIANIFGINKDDKVEHKPVRSESMDYVSRVPIVDLYGPSLFNITPPNLKQKMWQAHSSDVCALQFDQTGKKLISGGNDKLVKIWDTGSGQALGVLRGCTSSILCAQYAPNYAFVCAAGNDCQLHLWNVKTQRQIRVYNGHTNKITSMAFTHDSRLIFSGSHDRTIKLWDVESAACKYTMSAQSSINDLALSPDEYYLATAHLDGCIRFWSKRDRKKLFELKEHQPHQTNGIQFSPPDGIQILTSSKDGRIIIWDLRKQQKLHEIVDKKYKNTNLTGKPCYSPDGQWVLGGASIPSTKLTGKYSLFIWKTKTEKLQHDLTEHTAAISKVIWHGRGGVASSDRSGMIAMWC